MVKDHFGAMDIIFGRQLTKHSWKYLLLQCFSTFGKMVHTLLFNENFILTTDTRDAEE